MSIILQFNHWEQNSNLFAVSICKTLYQTVYPTFIVKISPPRKFVTRLIQLAYPTSSHGIPNMGILRQGWKTFLRSGAKFASKFILTNNKWCQTSSMLQYCPGGLLGEFGCDIFIKCLRILVCMLLWGWHNLLTLISFGTQFHKFYVVNRKQSVIIGSKRKFNNMLHASFSMYPQILEFRVEQKKCMLLKLRCGQLPITQMSIQNKARISDASQNLRQTELAPVPLVHHSCPTETQLTSYIIYTDFCEKKVHQVCYSINNFINKGNW